MKLYGFLFLFVVIFTLFVSAENCEFGGWEIPNISNQGTIFMDGNWWTVEEFPSGTGIVRKIERTR